MKRLFFCALGVIFLTCSVNAQMPPALDAWIEAARLEWKAPGVSVTIVKDGKLFVAKGYGVRELGKPEPVDENTMWDIASLAKSFTTAAIATLVDEGKMRWDDPVRRHLPGFELSDDYRSLNVTIRDLLCHRSGIERGDFLWRFTNYDTREVIRRTRYMEMREPFRATFSYNNVGYTIAGEAAAAAAGMSWSDLVRTRLLEPHPTVTLRRYWRAAIRNCQCLGYGCRERQKYQRSLRASASSWQWNRLAARSRGRKLFPE